MKKYFLLLSVAMFAVCSVVAQPRAIGVRVGPNMELSFQQSLNYSKNFLELNFGYFNFQGLQGAVTYNWVSTMGSNTGFGRWSSYAGFGGGGGYNWTDNSWYQEKDGVFLREYVFLGVVGMLGLEYDFGNIPLALSLDYRPLFGVDLGTRSVDNKFGIQYHKAGLWNFGLSARFLF